MSQHKGQLTVAFVSTAQQTNKSRFTLVGVQKYALDAPLGTNRTNRAGLTMSVDRGRPEVVGRESNRRD